MRMALVIVGAFALYASVCGVRFVYGADFPSAHESPPAWWPSGRPVFELSDDYPKDEPAPEAYPWEKYEFETEGLEYLSSVLQYVYDGNIKADWRVQSNPVRKWYNVPWLHSGAYGREFIRGLTRERTSAPGELWSSPQSPRAQNWAIGFYNAPGGWIIGKFWGDPAAPNPRAALQFPNGTVAAKLLFTTATPQDVPYLKGAVEWTAFIHKSIDCSSPDVDAAKGFFDGTPLCDREVQTVRLLQIDVAVKDKRATQTGWVFGTFVYDGQRPGKTAWDRMVPVGLMWGNDPGTTPKNVSEGYQLKQTVINRAPIPPQHLGCAGRLSGPVDNVISSCLSCHATAQYLPVRLVPQACDDATEDMKYFENYSTSKPFDPGSIWMDYSLQLSAGFYNFCMINKSYAGCASTSTLLKNDLIKTIAPFRGQ